MSKEKIYVMPRHNQIEDIDTDHGYGFIVTYDPELLFQFVCNHKNSYIHANKDNESNFEQMTEEYNSFHNDGFFDENNFLEAIDHIDGAFWINAIADIMNAETGLSCFIGVMGDWYTDSDDSVLFMPTYPWMMTEKDKNLTCDELKAICKKYAEELDIPEEDIGDLHITHLYF